ncbi:MAG: bifunctional diaminohydroxyphosphoribosylaminopyrimidine deaminase/5-amino-6-(5-phosphoribosylamino)uracil reductase RibD [Treponema sp.]
MKDSFISNYMKAAIEEAKKGKGFANPNPLVGAVLVKNGKIIGKGFHEKFGTLHAERNAIKNAVELSGNKKICNGSSLFVTLEPCCHSGKQPPCTDAIIENKIKEVYIGSKDPNPLVNGKGISILKEHGIKVFEGILQDECDELNPFFFHFIKTKTPYVILKYAMSMNGTSIIKNKNKRISSDESIKKVHETRSAVMGIMASARTVNTDDSLLTARHEENCHQPARIILDRNLKIKLNRKILKTADISPLIIFYSAEKYFKIKKLRAMNVQLIKAPLKNNHLDLKKIFSILGQMNFDSILLESSGKLAQAVMQENIADKVQIFVASNFITKSFRKELNAKPCAGFYGNDVFLEYDLGK